MADRLTKAQYRTLSIMETRDRVDSSSPIVRRRIGMMRLMAERGLVSHNLHGEWSIKRAGREAVEAYETALTSPSTPGTENAGE